MCKPDSISWSVLLWVGILALAGCQSTVAESPTRSDPPGEERNPRAAVDPEPPAPVARFGAVYFELDRSDLGAEARRTLASNAQEIQARPDLGVITIEGHCDERGSEAYNVALGRRRAEAVERHLLELGVPASRLRAVSYGESRPAAPGSGERAWRLNRRSELRSGLHQAAR